MLLIRRKMKQEEHEDRKKAIRAAGASATYGQLPPAAVAPAPTLPTYHYGQIMAEDARSQNGYMPGYGMRQTGRPTPPGTLHGYGPTYAQNPAPSMYGGSKMYKAVYYDEKEPEYPTTYGTQGYGGGIGLYGTGVYNLGGSVFQGNYR